MFPQATLRAPSLPPTEALVIPGSKWRAHTGWEPDAAALRPGGNARVAAAPGTGAGCEKGPEGSHAALARASAGGGHPPALSEEGLWPENSQKPVSGDPAEEGGSPGERG